MSWDIIIDGTAFPMTSYGAIVTNMSGVGMPQLQHSITPYAASPGGVHQRVKVQPRSFTIQAALPGTSMKNIHALRSALIDALRPDRTTTPQPIKLRYSGGSVPLEIEAFYDAGLEFGDMSGYTENVTMRFVAPDPFFYGTNDQSAISSNDFSKGSFVAIYNNKNYWTTTNAVNFNPLFRPPLMNARVIPDSQNSDGMYELKCTTPYGTVTSDSVHKYDGTTWTSYAGTMGIPANHRVLCVAEYSGIIVTIAGSITPSAGSIVTICRAYHPSLGWAECGTVVIETPTPNTYSDTYLPAVSMKNSGGYIYLYGNRLFTRSGRSTTVQYGGSADPILFFNYPHGFENPGGYLYHTVIGLRTSTGTTLNQIGSSYPYITDVHYDGVNVYAVCPSYGSVFVSMGLSFLGSTPSPTDMILGSVFKIAPSWGIGARSVIGVADKNVLAITYDGTSQIMIGGDFSTINNTSSHHVSIYDTTNLTWNSVGTVSPIVNSLAYDNDRAAFFAGNYMVYNQERAGAFGGVSASLAYYKNGLWRDTSLHARVSYEPRYCVVINTKKNPIVLRGSYYGNIGNNNIHMTMHVNSSSVVYPLVILEQYGSFIITIAYIENITTGDRIDFTSGIGTGLTVSFGGRVTIDIKNRIFVSESLGKITRYIRAWSDMSSFSLVPGDNDIVVGLYERDGDPYMSTTDLSISARGRYWSADG